MNISQALEFAAASFKEAGIESSYIDARLLLSHILNKPIEYILSTPEENLSVKHYQKFSRLVKRRSNLEPIAYILGYKEFYDQEFKVSKGVLIPRADTEILIDAVLSSVNNKLEELQILELGVGSGCIIITLLLHLSKAKAIGCDVSDEAILIAGKNAKKHKVSDRLKLIKSNWFEEVTSQKFDVIVSNPPYISKLEENLVSKTALLYEPWNALFADDNGLKAYKEIAQRAKYFLKKNGKIFLEIGINQANMVKKIFNENSYIEEKIYFDLAGIARVISFRNCG